MCILSLIDSIGRLARWRLRLFEFDFDVIYRASVKHEAADTLPRLQTAGEEDTPLKDKLPLLAVNAKGYNPAC